ncbi:MAG: energy transducer TonB [Xanthobacteraceae bacterium]
MRRWALSAALVLLAHGGVAAAVVHWHEDTDAAPSSAIVIDLAPGMMAPDEVQQEMPPGPEQVQAEAAREVKTEQVEEKTETKAEQEPEQKIAEAPHPDVALAPQSSRPEPEPVPMDNQVPAPATTAPQVPKIEESPVATAPVQAQLNVSDATAVPTWKKLVVSALERNKRYPAAAQARNERGTAQLAFSLDRQGRVTASRIVHSSGSAALDQETLDLVRRAQPFPPPPAVMPGAHIDLTVPIRFNMH